MNVHETIFRAKEFIALEDFANARSLLRTVDTNHVAIRLLEEIDATEAQKRLAAAQAKLVAQQTQAAKDLRAIPSLASMLIIGNTFFWSLLISLWFSPIENVLQSFSASVVIFSLLLGLYYLFMRRNWRMLAFGWTFLSLGLSITVFIVILRSVA